MTEWYCSMAFSHFGIPSDLEWKKIKVSTLPYPEDLLKARGYTGFSSVYGDVIKATEPGREWDKVLIEYCMNIREKPAWGISSSDYHNEHPAPFGTYISTFLVKNRDKNEVMEAIREGRMYNYIGPRERRIRLELFEIEDARTRKRAIIGETISCTNPPIIRIKARSYSPENGYPLTLKIIRSGKVCYQQSEKEIIDLLWTDSEAEPGRKHFYRIEIKGKGRMLSNPIFVDL
jgi:hypothetical protein